MILNALCQGLHAHLASRLSDKLHVQETRLLSIFMGPHEVNNMLKLGLLCLSNIQKQKTNKNLNKWEKQKHMKKHSQIYKQLYIASRFNECKSLLPQADPTPIYEAECLANCGSDTWNHHLDTCAPISVVLEEVNVTFQSTASVH